MQIKGESVNKSLKPQLDIPADIGSPILLEPVLAEIEHINDLGKSQWYEVVYEVLNKESPRVLTVGVCQFDENCQSYAGSKTFKDGEKVIKWKYAKDCL